MKTSTYRAAGLAALAVQALPAGAEVRLPAILSEHMVLQRAARVPVWGWAAPGEGVSVRFGNQAHSVQAEPNGRWRIHLDLAGAPQAPGVLVVRGDAEPGQPRGAAGPALPVGASDSVQSAVALKDGHIRFTRVDER